MISWEDHSRAIVYLIHRYNVYLLPRFVYDLRDVDHSYDKEQCNDINLLFCTLTYRKSLSDSVSNKSVNDYFPIEVVYCNFEWN